MCLPPIRADCRSCACQRRGQRDEELGRTRVEYGPIRLRSAPLPGQALRAIGSPRGAALRESNSMEEGRVLFGRGPLVCRIIRNPVEQQAFQQPVISAAASGSFIEQRAGTCREISRRSEVRSAMRFAYAHSVYPDSVLHMWSNRCAPHFLPIHTDPFLRLDPRSQANQRRAEPFPESSWDDRGGVTDLRIDPLLPVSHIRRVGAVHSEVPGCTCLVSPVARSRPHDVALPLRFCSLVDPAFQTTSPWRLLGWRGSVPCHVAETIIASGSCWIVRKTSYSRGRIPTGEGRTWAIRS